MIVNLPEYTLFCLTKTYVGYFYSNLHPGIENYYRLAESFVEGLHGSWRELYHQRNPIPSYEVLFESKIKDWLKDFLNWNENKTHFRIVRQSFAKLHQAFNALVWHNACDVPNILHKVEVFPEKTHQLTLSKMKYLQKKYYFYFWSSVRPVMPQSSGIR